jgi:hypothetical protein
MKESWEVDSLTENREAVIILLLASKRLLNGKLIQTTGQTHFDKHCEY